MCRKQPKSAEIAQIFGVIDRDNSDFGVKLTYETDIKLLNGITIMPFLLTSTQ
jgi:hypothetical protein